MNKLRIVIVLLIVESSRLWFSTFSNISISLDIEGRFLSIDFELWNVTTFNQNCFLELMSSYCLAEHLSISSCMHYHFTTKRFLELIKSLWKGIPKRIKRKIERHKAESSIFWVSVFVILVQINNVVVLNITHV